MNIARQVESYAKRLFQRIEPWLIEPTVIETTHRLCLSIEGNSLSLLHINNNDGIIDIVSNEKFEFDTIDSLNILLTTIVKRYQLTNIPTTWLLLPNDYQLFFIDSLPVKGDEFKDALNWRLRSLLATPIHETATDYFLLPGKKGVTSQPMVVAVTANKEFLSRHISVLENANINLAVIDIPELALRNLTATFENDEKSTAFLYFYQNIAILNITRQKSLYFTRRVTIANSERNLPEFYEKLSLEILRYLDYFQSQWRYPSPSRFYIASEHGDAESIVTNLNKHLQIQLEPFPVSSIIVGKSQQVQLNNYSLLTLGALLRQEKTNVAAKY